MSSKQTSKVAIVRCDGYHQEAVDAAVREALRLSTGPDLTAALALGPGPGVPVGLDTTAPVLVKPNLLAARPPDDGIDTHPVVVSAVISLLKEVGARDIVVGDSSGGSGVRPTATDKALKVSGIGRAARDLGAEALSFDHDEVAGVPSPRGPQFAPLGLARVAVQARAVVSVSKFKTHALTLLTGAVKNLFGTVPGAAKRQYHQRNPALEAFSNVLVDINLALREQRAAGATRGTPRPMLHVVDAVVAMEGNGPSAGSLRKLGFIAAGTDPVAVDAVLAAVVGVRPRRVPTTHLGAERGLGEADFGRIEVVGLPVPEVAPRRFRLPVAQGFLAVVPPALTGMALSLTLTRPTFRPELCTRCAICVKNCPADALTLGEKVPLLDDGRCIGCFCCHELCPSQAVELGYRHPLGRALFGRRPRVH